MLIDYACMFVATNKTDLWNTQMWSPDTKNKSSTIASHLNGRVILYLESSFVLKLEVRPDYNGKEIQEESSSSGLELQDIEPCINRQKSSWDRQLWKHAWPNCQCLKLIKLGVETLPCSVITFCEICMELGLGPIVECPWFHSLVPHLMK